MRVFISTVPFGEADRKPLDLLEENNIEYVVNEYGRRLTEGELKDVIGEFDAVIAGTEPITKSVLDSGNRLKLISRVGIGLDNVDLVAAKANGVKVSYTPDAPSPAVAELTIGLMLSLLRYVHISNENMRRGQWHRHFGRRLSESVVGILGVGRIGKRVIRHLGGFGCKQLLLFDVDKTITVETDLSYSWCDWDALLNDSDILTVHVPLTPATKNLIGKRELNMMKPDAVLINTARGGVVNETDLCDVLLDEHLSGVGMDVFCEEPYFGPLVSIQRCILTAHMGSMSLDCRLTMEEEATLEVIRLASGQPLRNLVPTHEFDLQALGCT